MLIKPQLIRPTYKSGYARCAAESANPGPWKELDGLWVPTLGPTGLTLRDVSGHGNHGTLTNMDPATDWQVGPRGWGLELDGTTERIQCPIVDVASSPGLTVIVSAQYDSSGANEHTLVSTWETSTASFLLRLEPSNDTLECFVVMASNTTKSTTSAVFAPADGFHHFGMRFDTTNLTAIIDGELSGTPTATGTTLDSQSSTKPLMIGYDQTRDPLTGTVGFVLVSRRAWTEEEIAEFYTNPYAMITPRRRTYFYTAGGAPAGNNVPQKWMHYQRMRAG